MLDTSALSSVLTGIQSQQPAPVAAPTAPPAGPLANLQAILSGTADYGQVMQKIGSGMSNMSNSGGDPFLSFAQGFGGAQKYTTEEQRLAAERAAAAEKSRMDANLALQRLTQDQSQFDASLSNNQSQFSTRSAQEQQQHAERMELERQASTRADQIAADSRRKTDAELIRLAKKEGISVDQMLSIERIAQAEAENEIDPERRRAVTDAARERLTQRVKSGRMSEGPGITESDTSVPAVSYKEGDTSTHPDGRRMVFQGGAWVPLTQ